MKRLAIAGLVTLLSISASWADPASPTGPSGGPPSGTADTGRPDGGPRRGPPDGDRDGGWHRDHEGGWRHHPMMLGMKAGHLRFRRGETGIDFKCAADDSTKACIDALMPLVDKLLQPR